MRAISILVVATGYTLVVLFLGTAMARAAWGEVGAVLWVLAQVAFFAHLWWTNRRRVPAA